MGSNPAGRANNNKRSQRLQRCRPFFSSPAVTDLCRRTDAGQSQPRFAERVTAHAPVDAQNVNFDVLIDHPAHQFMFEVQGWGARLILIGHQGKGRMGRRLAGSVAMQAMHHATRSVVAARQRRKAIGGHREMREERGARDTRLAADRRPTKLNF